MIHPDLSAHLRRRLQPATELKAHLDRPGRYAFRCSTAAKARAWQARCRAALEAAVGFLDTPATPARPVWGPEVDRGTWTRRKVLIRTSSHSSMPVYLLNPKGRPPLATVLAYAGHGYGARDVVGLWEDGRERHVAEGYQKDFAVALVGRGFRVAVPEIACFGERQNELPPAPGGAALTSCRHAAAQALMAGRSVLGMRLRDAVRLLDFVATLDGVGRVGVMGISGGGMLAFFHAAVDPRVGAAVVSGYLGSFRESVLAGHHCLCNYVPGMLAIGEHRDLVGLLAPRPLLIESGDHDPIFPAAAARRTWRRARHVWRLFDAPAGAVELDAFEGRHEIHGLRAYPFLERWLGGGGAAPDRGHRRPQHP